MGPIKHMKAAVRSVLRYTRFAGRRYYCPLCKKHARLFTPSQATPGQPIIDKYRIISMGKRPHYRCPWCNSSDKERLVWAFLENKTDVLEGIAPKSVLHVAPERNTTRRLKAVPRLTYLSGDMFEGDERYTTQRYGGAIYLDITDMAQLADNSFDAVICNHVMEHVPDDSRGMREILRVLKPGGFAILQTPVSRTIPATIEGGDSTPEERIEKYGQADHVRIYKEGEYVARLAAAGFAVRAWTPQEISDKAELYGVNLDERVYVATKPRA